MQKNFNILNNSDLLSDMYQYFDFGLLGSTQHLAALDPSRALLSPRDISVCPYLILVSGGGVLFFPAGVPFSTENTEETVYCKVYTENITHKIPFTPYLIK